MLEVGDSNGKPKNLADLGVEVVEIGNIHVYVFTR